MNVLRESVHLFVVAECLKPVPDQVVCARDGVDVATKAERCRRDTVWEPVLKNQNQDFSKKVHVK